MAYESWLVSQVGSKQEQNYKVLLMGTWTFSYIEKSIVMNEYLFSLEQRMVFWINM